MAQVSVTSVPCPLATGLLPVQRSTAGQPASDLVLCVAAAQPERRAVRTAGSDRRAGPVQDMYSACQQGALQLLGRSQAGEGLAEKERVCPTLGCWRGSSAVTWASQGPNHSCSISHLFQSSRAAVKHLPMPSPTHSTHMLQHCMHPLHQALLLSCLLCWPATRPAQTLLTTPPQQQPVSRPRRSALPCPQCRTAWQRGRPAASRRP